MAGPYRESTAASIQCPRCGQETPPGELVACIDGCGIWVTSEAATTLFEASELKRSRVTSWFRERCACPLCSKVMSLYGHDMSLFLGCDAHGFWVDDSTVTQTGLGRSSAASRVADARVRAKAIVDARKRAAAEARAAREAAASEASARDEAARLEALARRMEEARVRAARLEAVRPYLDLIAAAVESRDFLPLAEKLRELEERIARTEASRHE